MTRFGSKFRRKFNNKGVLFNDFDVSIFEHYIFAVIFDGRMGSKRIELNFSWPSKSTKTTLMIYESAEADDYWMLESS